jgi:predicted amidohydrolase
MESGKVRIALAQMPAGRNVDDICRQAAAGGADIVVLPEMYAIGYRSFDETDPEDKAVWLASAEPIDGPHVTACREAARRHRVAVVATLLERAEPKPFNTAVLIDAKGEIVLTQRKRHICFFGAPESECAAGTTSDVVRLHMSSGDCIVGLMICMDREYSDVADDLVRQGAELLLVPNSCPLQDDPDIGDVRLAGIRAMAFERVVAMAVTNYPAPKDDGHSLLVDPLGRVVAMGGRDEQLVFGDVDLDQLRQLQTSEWFRRVR